MTTILSMDQAVAVSDIKGRLMKLGHPSNGPFQFDGLFLVTGTRMKGFMSKRHALIDAIHIKSGQTVTFSGIGPEFALTLFSNKRF